MQIYCDLESEPRNRFPSGGEKHGKIGRTQCLNVRDRVWIQAVALTNLSQKDSNYASNSSQHADRAREEKHQPCSSGRSQPNSGDSGAGQSWLLLAGLDG